MSENYQETLQKPTRTGVIKPDITAGGDVALSAGPMALLNNPTGNALVIDSGGWHVRNGGTSMASPIVAGVAALYLERCPEGTYSGFKSLLTSTAFTGQYSGTVPNNAYGYGKVHALNLMTAVVVEPKPTITQNDDMLISSLAPNYQWLKDAQELVGETAQILTITPPNADYQVMVESTSGECISRSDVHNSNLGLEEANEHGAILVPNPASDQVVVIANTPIDNVECFDQQGKAVYLPKIGKDTYGVKHLSPGYYQIRVSGSNSVVHIKMLRID